MGLDDDAIQKELSKIPESDQSLQKFYEESCAAESRIKHYKTHRVLVMLWLLALMSTWPSQTPVHPKIEVNANEVVIMSMLRQLECSRQ